VKDRNDSVFLVLTGLFVAGLAIVAGAISFAHMAELAADHDQNGWKAYAFPVSVDGLEIVASLYLVVQRRAGRPTGSIAWVALIVGTLASLAANVAVGGDDLIGKALAGWPALSMLVSVKLLFSMFDHVDVDQEAVREDQRTVWDDQRPSADRPSISGTDRDSRSPSGTVPARRTDDGGPFTTGAAIRPAELGPVRSGDPATRVDISTVTHLIPAAREARMTLANAGRSLSRDGLADTMRDNGHGVSNARASLLLKILKAERDGDLAKGHSR